MFSIHENELSIYDVYGASHTAPVECVTCGRVEFAANAQREGWVVEDKEKAIDFRGHSGAMIAKCPKCRYHEARERKYGLPDNFASLLEKES